MPLDVSEATRREYAARLNRVVDHIQDHLADPLDLEALARIACFSPFHFHRLFRAWTGETLQAFISRLRLEKAAHQLRYSPFKPITEIALDCGFGSSSAFARAFREHHGMPASAWRKRKLGQVVRKAGKEIHASVAGCSVLPGWSAAALEIPMTTFPLTVQVQDLPAHPIAYVRNVGPYKGNPALFERLYGVLCGWAGPRGLIQPGTCFMNLYHDNPDITPEAKQRIEVALSVPEGTQPAGEIGVKVLEGGRYAMARIDILPHQYEEAWQSLVAGWLPGSGYQFDDRPALEIYRNDPATDPNGRHILDLCLPVRPL